jgi:hypothetical protein
MERYQKVLQLGDPHLDGILEGNIVVEEKLDGSQFRINITAKGEMLFGSKAVSYTDGTPAEKMFNKPIAISEEQFKELAKPSAFEYHIFAEYLSSKHHNTLIYAREPQNNIVIFDVKIELPDMKSSWMNYEDKKAFAKKYGFEVPQLIYKGDGRKLTKDKINELLETTSMLGGQKVEGIVIKHYDKYYDILRFPQFAALANSWMVGKYVREEFTELNKENWKQMKGSPLEAIYESLKNPNRWNKAWQHLQEEGKLSHTLRDIPLLIAESQRDLQEEEKENIKEQLWRIYDREMMRNSIRGLPEWYKQKLLENIEKKD